MPAGTRILTRLTTWREAMLLGSWCWKLRFRLLLLPLLLLVLLLVLFSTSWLLT